MDIFDTRVLLRAIELMFPPSTFVLDLFFGGAPREDVSSVETVDVDIYKGGKTLAPFQRPVSEGKVVGKAAFASRTIKLPYIKPKMPTKASDMLKRQAGENPYSTRTPADRARDQLNKDLVELQNMIVRREEWMACQALVNGKVAIVGDDINAEVDFLRSAAHNIVLAAGATWLPADNPVIDTHLVNWRSLASQKSGLVADAAVMGTAVSEVVLHDAGLAKLLDNRRTEVGMLQAKEKPIDGRTYIGNVRGIDLWAYEETYTDGNGATQPMIPPNRIVLGPTSANNGCKRHYGAIQDLKATVPVRMFPKSWETDDPSVRWLMLQSAPLPATHIPDAFVSADVLTGAI